MTAETLKPFITSPSISNYVGGGSKRNYISVGLAVLMFILIGGIFGVTMWKIFQLQNDVDTLKKFVVGLQKRPGVNCLDDISDHYLSANIDDLLDDDEDVDEEDEDGDLLDTFDEDDDDYSDEDDFNFTGSGKDALLDDDDNYDGINGDNDDSDAVDDSLADDLAKFHRENKRKTRSISRVNGLPIYHESYALRRNKTGGPDDEKIEKLLLNKSPRPTLRYNWDDKESRKDIADTIPPRTQYMEARAGPATIVQMPAHLFNERYHHQQQVGIIGNRVGNGHEENYPRKSTAEIHQHVKGPRRISGVLAVHYNVMGISNKGITKSQFGDDFYTLSPNSWSIKSQADEAFSIHNGFVTIKVPGIYLIYAQILYDNNKATNGYSVFHNSRVFLECTLTDSGNAAIITNTCHTSGAIYLHKDDKIYLKDMFKGHNANFGNSKSFLGLIRLGSAVVRNSK